MTSHPPQTLIATLKARFESNQHRHPGVAWALVQARLESSPTVMRSLGEMESSGGEPDVIATDGMAGPVTFCDCAPESPVGRRSLCYDRQALDARKENKPRGCVLEWVASMGVELLTEPEYRRLQELGEFDTRTSSWVATPAGVRALGGALFCDRRYGQVFVYHNGADAYFAARGFRALLRV